MDGKGEAKGEGRGGEGEREMEAEGEGREAMIQAHIIIYASDGVGPDADLFLSADCRGQVEERGEERDEGVQGGGRGWGKADFGNDH